MPYSRNHPGVNLCIYIEYSYQCNRCGKFRINTQYHTRPHVVGIPFHRPDTGLVFCGRHQFSHLSNDQKVPAMAICPQARPPSEKQNARPHNVHPRQKLRNSSQLEDTLIFTQIFKQHIRNPVFTHRLLRKMLHLNVYNWMNHRLNMKNSSSVVMFSSHWVFITQLRTSAEKISKCCRARCFLP